MEDRHPLCSVVVLNWNGESLLRECLPSVLATTYAPTEVLVVDNASTDGSLDVLQKYPQVRIVRNETNLGYAEGNNVGLRHARGKYVAVLNNDVAVEPGWLDEAVRHLEADDSVGMVSCRQMRHEDHGVVDSLFSVPTSHLLPERMGHGQRFERLRGVPGVGLVLGASGASAVYRKSMFDTLGGFESAFFAYQEECDLHMRAFLAGWKCLYVGGCVVYHKGSATFRRASGTFHYYHERNRVWYIYRNYPAAEIMRNLPVILLREIRTALNICIRQRLPRVYLRARVDGFAGMGRFASMRRANCAAFRANYDGFLRLKRCKIVPYERPTDPAGSRSP